MMPRLLPFSLRVDYRVGEPFRDDARVRLERGTRGYRRNRDREIVVDFRWQNRPPQHMAQQRTANCSGPRSHCHATATTHVISGDRAG